MSTGTQFSSSTGRMGGPGRKSSGAQDRRIDREHRPPAAREHGQPQRQAGAQRDEPQLGFPRRPQEPDAEPSQDFRHVRLLSQHINMQGLGREAPFGVRTSLTGEYRQILDRQSGQVPFDIFED